MKYQSKLAKLVIADILKSPYILLKSISVKEILNDQESEVFYYHGDHLGSANWITDANGSAVQYIHYAPYGELIDNQKTTYDERYKFTGKERDEETGYDYFGARYLSSLLGHWLSVDPLSDKYPNISPYAYCSWNPIKFVDPDGRYFDDANEKTAQKIEAKVHKKLKYAKKDNDRMRELCSTLIDIIDMRYDEDHEYRFESTRGKLASDKGITDDTPATQYGGLNDKGIQVINMFSHLKKLDGTTAHEARHGGQIARGEIFYDEMGYSWNYGVRKEVDAYRAQWAWEGKLKAFVGDPFCMIPQIVNILQYNQINTDFVNSILEFKSFERIYPPKKAESGLWNNQ